MTFITNCLRDLGIEEFDAWIYYERLMQELGLDPSSFALAFSWAVDCVEKGILTTAQTDGLVSDARPVDGELANRMPTGKGEFGNLLADGVAEASCKIVMGRKTSLHVKALLRETPRFRRQSGPR
jgi:aldehyde:ferredoxin oxidoreductase